MASAAPPQPTSQPAPQPSPQPAPRPPQPPQGGNTAPKSPPKPPTKRRVNKTAAALNVLTMLLSVPILVSSIWLYWMKTYKCEDILNLWPLQRAIIVSLGVVFVASNVTIFLRKRWLMFLFLGFLSMSCLLVLLFILGLVLSGTYSMANQSISASPARLAAKVYDKNNWENIKECLRDEKVCDKIASKLSPIELGCCIRPAICGMLHVNRKNNDADQCDCDNWQKNRSELWYDCFSCKQGFLKQLSTKWVSLGKFLICISALLVVCHVLSFVASMWERIMEGSLVI